MIRVGILTASDKGSRGERVDISGQKIKEMVEAKGFQVVATALLPDDKEELSEQMRAWCDDEVVDLLLTTGGTGFSQRDLMPEATTAIIERMVPGIPEAMRYESMKVTNRAILSRGVAGIRKTTLIINLPGSPKAVEENLATVIDTLEHGIHILKGTANECARSV